LFSIFLNILKDIYIIYLISIFKKIEIFN